MRDLLTAHRVSPDTARRHYAAGATVIVASDNRGATLAVGPSTVTHDNTRGTWETLAADVDTWRNRYPDQTYYVMPGGELNA